MADLVAGLRLRAPIVQAGMGGGLASHRLAAAVSEAGGLGTIGILPPPTLEEELRAARRLTSGPIAVNLIVPLARSEHWRAAAGADAIVTHWEPRPRRRAPGAWIHTCGSPDEARAAVRAGADAVIAQGAEAGGHVRGKRPAGELLERILAALPDGFPVLLAGGIAERGDVAAALERGAQAAVAGTRFLASEESRAHPDYKRRLLGGRRTVLTELFGMGWPGAPHRVMPNRATERWLESDSRGPAWLRATHGALSPVGRRVPASVQLRMTRRASAGPLDLIPAAPADDLPAETVETHPLYAGETVARITDVRPAAELVRELTP